MQTESPCCIVCRCKLKVYDNRCLDCLQLGQKRARACQCPDCGKPVKKAGEWCALCFNRDLTGLESLPATLSYITGAKIQ